MRIAILTHPLGTNYGGMLQNYALQHVLKQMGHTPVTLNYQFDTSWRIKILSLGSHVLKRLKGGKVPLRAWPTKKEYEQITQHTKRFISDHIEATEPFLLDDINKQDFGKIDAIIVGSDQVWRGSHPAVPHFFLSDFKDAGCKKIAYAASFGVDFWEFSDENTELCKKLIKQFDAISVRENGGVALCKQYFYVKPQLVLDPTLLLEKNDYYSLQNISNMPSGEAPYMMTYVLDKTPEKQAIIDSISKKSGFSPRTVMVGNYFSEVGSRGVDSCVYPPVEDWIAGFKNANFVVTDSFHGTVFSIIFHKPFVAIVNRNRGADRFTSLLSQLNLENRLVESVEEAMVLLNSKIDYEAVDVALEDKRKKSINFLIEALT